MTHLFAAQIHVYVRAQQHIHAITHASKKLIVVKRGGLRIQPDIKKEHTPDAVLIHLRECAMSQKQQNTVARQDIMAVHQTAHRVARAVHHRVACTVPVPQVQQQ